MVKQWNEFKKSFGQGYNLANTLERESGVNPSRMVTGAGIGILFVPLAMMDTDLDQPLIITFVGLAFLGAFLIGLGEWMLMRRVSDYHRKSELEGLALSSVVLVMTTMVGLISAGVLGLGNEVYRIMGLICLAVWALLRFAIPMAQHNRDFNEIYEDQHSDDEQERSENIDAR